MSLLFGSPPSLPCYTKKEPASTAIEKVRLSNGVMMPLLGYGTFLSSDPEELEKALRVALDAGYRYIDTAHFYNNEQVIGKVVEEYIKNGKLKRSDVFIATKLALFGHNDVDNHVSEALKRLRTDYIDLFLFHSPMPFKSKDGNLAVDEKGQLVPDLTPHIETWRRLEKHYNDGVLRAIGVCNFNAAQLKKLYKEATVKPHNLQIELHIFHQQYELLELARQLNIKVTSYGSLGSPGSTDFRGNASNADCLGHPLVVELAAKYKKSTAQILLRQIVQRGISVIPKSTNSTRIRDNMNVFDFTISNDDMARFCVIENDVQLFFFDFARSHPWYPW